MKLLKNRYPKYTSVIILLCAVLAQNGFSQTIDSVAILSLEQAIDYALLNNQEIEIQRKEVEIVENKIDAGEAGLKPRVTLIGGADYANNISDVEIRTFMENPYTINFDNESNVETVNLNSAIQVDYVIFSGFSGKYRYELLQNAGNLARYQQEVIINNIILAISDIFFEIAKLQYQEELLQKNLELDSIRLQKVEDRQEFARASGLDILNAKTNISLDLNSLDEITLVKNNLILELNFLMGIDPTATYEVKANYLLPSNLDLESIATIIDEKNPVLKLLKEDITLSENQVMLSKANLYPQLSSFANYGFFWQRNDLQQLAQVQNIGLTVGVSLRYNLFDGKRIKRSIENAQLNHNLNTFKLTQAKDKLLNDALIEISNQENLKIRLQREQDNLKTFQENYERTEERYLVGKSNSLEVREAQIALLAAELNIYQMQIDLLKSSLELESIKGTLVSQ